MVRMLRHSVTRWIAEFTVVCLVVLCVPPARAYRDTRASGRITFRAPKSTGRVRTDGGTGESLRVLTRREMRLLRGAGQYRNAALAGTRPWQRTFRDVNLCTGNLMKSYTDIQVPGTRGPGLAWQRTYNSQDDRVGPFGVGWTHAYDIRIGEAGNNEVPHTGFLGTQHVYQRDADGLYSPPVYSTMMMESRYVVRFLETGDPAMLPEADTQYSQDGTKIHYIPEGTLANGDPRPTRVCDYIEDRHGNRTTLTYGQEITLPDGGTKKLLTRVTDPVGRYLEVSWVNLGTPANPVMRIERVAGPFDGEDPVYEVRYEYNAEGNLWKVRQDPAGIDRVTTFGYTTVQGETGLLTSITDPAGRVMDYEYGVASLTNTVWVTRVLDPGPLGNRQEWRLSVQPGSPTSGVEVMDETYGIAHINVWVDGYLRVVGLMWPSDNESCGASYTYDADFNVTRAARGWASGQDGYVARLMTYDLAGHLLTQSYEGFANSTMEFEYWGPEKYWQKKRQTDPPLPDGRRPVTQWDYAAKDDPNPGRRGQVVCVTDAEGGSFTYDYNQYGQKTEEVNANGVATTFSYDDNWGNLTQVVQDPGGLNRTTTMTYDVAGRVVSSTDPMNRTSTFSYNGVGQPLMAAFQGETITYTYEADGQPGMVTDNRGTTTIVYEPETGRVHSVTDPVTGTVSYEYDRAGNRRFVNLPGGGRVEYQYIGGRRHDPDAGSFDAVNNLVRKVIDDQGRDTDYYYRGFAQWVAEARTAKGYQGQELWQYVKTEYTYDRLPDNHTRGWLVRVKHSWNWRNMGMWQSRVLWQNDYAYSNGGQRLTNTITDNVGQQRTETYGYDRLYRLTSVNYGDGEVQTYTFDPMGNRLTKTVNGIPEGYTYNNANMLLTRGGEQYTNDLAGNTLTGGGRTMTWDSQNRMTSCTYNGTTSTFTYGADGLRRRMVVGQNTTDYVLDGQNVVREIRNGQVEAFYLYGPRGPEYRRDAAGNVEWYLFDGLGSVVATVDSSGNVLDTRKYDVYGAVRAGGAGTRHKFVGQLGHTSDDETGLLYMRARYYDPVVGRFVSEDPAGDGRNWLVYCDGDPVSHQDPSGRAKLNPIGDTGWFWSWDPWYDAGKGGRKLRDITIYTPGGKRTKWSWIPSEGRWKHSDPSVSLPRKVRSTIEGGGLGISSVDSYAEQDILGFIAIMLDIAGDHEGAAELDRISGTL